MRHLRGQAGFSLVEMMISMVIGLVLVAGAYRLFIGSTTTYKQQDDLSRLQENVRLATQVLAQDIRLAGYPRFAMNGAPFAGTPVTATNNPSALPCTTGCSDTIAVSYTNSAGNLTTVTFSIVGSVLQRNETAPVPPMVSGPVVDGVENMQVLYGMDTDPTDQMQSVDVPYQDTLAGGGQVIAVQVRLLMRTTNEIPEAALDTACYDVDGLATTPAAAVAPCLAGQEFNPVDDRRLRRIFTTTITLRNQLQ